MTVVIMPGPGRGRELYLGVYVFREGVLKGKVHVDKNVIRWLDEKGSN